MKQPTRLAQLPAGVLGAGFVLLWCTGYPAAKIALGHCTPFTLLTARFACAALIYGALSQLGEAVRLSRTAVLHSAAVGTLSLALQFGGAYWAAAVGVNVGIIALVIGTMPIIAALLGLTLGEAIRPLQWLGFACGFAGVALAVGEGIAPGSGASPGAVLALLLSLLGVSAGTLYQKRFGSNVDLRGALAIQNVVAAVLLLPLAAHEGLHFDGSGALLVSLGWLIVINSLGGFALLFVLLRRGQVNQVATLFFLMPPVTALLDYLVLGEPLSVFQVAGIALAAFGVYLATRPRPAAAPARTFSAPHVAAPRPCPAPGE